MGFAYIRFWVDSSIAYLGVILLVIATSLQIHFGYIHNKRWNSVLECMAAFPSIPGDTVISGRWLQCPQPSNYSSVHKEQLKRASDHDGLLIIVLPLLLISCILLLIPPLIFKRMRVGGYVFAFEQSYGFLGLAILSTFLMISFAVSEYQSNYANASNLLDPRVVLNLSQPSPRCTSRGDEDKLCFEWKTWEIIVLKCSLGVAQHGLSQQFNLADKLYDKYGGKGLRLGNGSMEYGYDELISLGFCPHAKIRTLFKYLVLVAVILFLLMSCVPCFIRSTPWMDNVDEERGMMVANEDALLEDVGGADDESSPPSLEGEGVEYGVVGVRVVVVENPVRDGLHASSEQIGIHHKRNSGFSLVSTNETEPFQTHILTSVSFESVNVIRRANHDGGVGSGSPNKKRNKKKPKLSREGGQDQDPSKTDVVGVAEKKNLKDPSHTPEEPTIDFNEEEEVVVPKNRNSEDGEILGGKTRERKVAKNTKKRRK